MATPSEIIDGVRVAIKESHKMPDKMSYLVQEADTTGSDANIKLPVCEIQTMSNIRLDPFNTDLVDVYTDEDGNSIGRVYESQYQLDLQIDLWCAEGSSHDADELGNELRNVLYNYDSSGPSANLEDEDGQLIENVWRFRLGDGERADDLALNPSLRRWRQEVTIWSSEVFRTTEDYLTGVSYPNPDNMSGEGEQISSN